jgi:hypothetical protein
MKSLMIFMPILVFALSPFDSPKPHYFDTSIYDTKETQESKMASENKKIKCRYVCDKKLYKVQQISSAVSYYKNLQKIK